MLVPSHWQSLPPVSGVRVDRYAQPGLVVGRFRCEAASPQWHADNAIGPAHLVVIPRRAVEICQQGRTRVLASPVRATFYHAHQSYTRGLVDPHGDECTYFGLSAPQWSAMVHEIRGTTDIDPDAPFDFGSGPIDPTTWLRHRDVLALLDDPAPLSPDRILEEASELVFGLLSAAIEAAGHRRHRPNNAARARRLELSLAVEALLLENFREPLSLSDIAERVGASPFHMARVFREHTGRSIHAVRHTLRLHALLQRVGEPGLRLADLALELGFSSHAHLTDQCRKAFGCTPTALRRDPSRLRQCRGRLTKTTSTIVEAATGKQSLVSRR
ncbi:MAG: AraC family transcriptional regulator [Myxococcota bacterium]